MSRRDYSNGSHSAQAAFMNNNTTSKIGNNIGPHEILAYNGSAEAVRERNAQTNLSGKSVFLQFTCELIAFINTTNKHCHLSSC